jgi:hypothetical protein
MSMMTRVETLYFDVLQFLYHLGLAILIGGAIALAGTGARSRIDGLAVLAVFVIVLTSVLKAVAFEVSGAPEPRLVLRWIALVVLAIATLYWAAWAGPVARSIRAQTAGFDDLRENAPARREVASLARSASRAMTVGVLAGVIALFLS